MKDTSTYIVAEGAAEVELIKRLLTDKLSRKVGVMNGRGHSAAASVAVTFLVRKAYNVILIADSDTRNGPAGQTKFNFLRDYLKMASPERFFRILLFKPEFEILFVQDRQLLERMTGKKVTGKEWEKAKAEPKKYIEESMKLSKPAFVKFIQNLSDEVIKSLRSTEFAKLLFRYIEELDENQEAA